MYHKRFCVVIVTLLLLYDFAEAKKTRTKNKRTKQEEENTAPQPDVVSYSTFGVNDVGTYEGFVPTSPDYARFLTANQEESTKQVGDGYPPSSVGSTAYSISLGSSQPYNIQSFTVSDNGNSQPNLVRYPQSAPSTYSEPTFASNNPYKNIPSQESYATKKEDLDSPVYGTKLNSRGRGKPFPELNTTEYNEVKISPSDDKKYFGYQETKTSFEKRPVENDFNNAYPQFPTYTALNSNAYGNAGLPDNESGLKFQRVVDFTKYASYYPELDTSQMPTPTKPDLFGSPNKEGSELFNNVPQQTENNNKLFQPAQSYRETYEPNRIEETPEKSIPKYNSYTAKENTYHFNNEANQGSKSSAESKKKTKDKDKIWASGGYDFNKWKDHFSPPKGYSDIYTEIHSNSSYKYENDEPKKPFNNHFDEILPAESNIDIPSYQLPGTDFSKFKKMPSYKVHEEDEFDKFPSFQESFKQSKPEFGKYKTSSSSSSYWGNVFPSSELSSFNRHPPKNIFDDVTNEEIVNIQPRRPNKWKYGNDNKESEWTQFGRRPTKSKPWNDWTKQIPSNRFKSEEDLLDLRNHDTSHPSYLPTHQSNYDYDDKDYKKLVEKWRQSYLKSKYRDSLRDYENYAETKPSHVALPKPYPIEVPHPVIVPVPQPYPVRVPVPKPVAVPIIQELHIPIEKPVPYPVYKKVPYPVEKRVPVPVEKEVAVPVMKPYPVHVPYIRPVFHHTRTRDEPEDIRHNDDYFPRPEVIQKVVHYRKKKPQGSRDRRRPSRTVHHQERNRRRWPDRRRPTNTLQRKPGNHPLPQKHREYEAEGYGEANDYYNYCRKTGNC